MKNDRSAPANPPAGSPGGESDAPPPSFELAMKRLSEIVEQLESGELPLDASLRLFEEGVGLSKAAGALIEAAERKVEALTRAADGSLGSVPFDAGDDDDR
jgi:exodeoxyribonuclease VII small subunit